MSSHPVLIPTSWGPVGAVVTEPDGERRAALMFLQGGAAGGRAGINAVWARLARELSAVGVVVLRADYSRKGDSHMIGGGGSAETRPVSGSKAEQDLRMMDEVIGWLAQRTGPLALHVGGACYGGRLAIHLAAEREDLGGLLLIAPFLRSPEVRGQWSRFRAGARPWARRSANGGASVQIDPAAVAAVERTLARARVWALVGEEDAEDSVLLNDRLSERFPLELDVVAGVALYPFHDPYVQAELLTRVVGRMRRTIARTPAL